MSTLDFYSRLIEYSDVITRECTKDSDEAVKSISAVVEALLKDSERINRMSSDTLSAIKGLEGVIAELSHTQGSSLTGVIRTLASLVKEHRSVNDVVMPVIEALQFQDALRQQMENMVKVMKVWHTRRSTFAAQPTPTALAAIGEEMLKCTTMQTERDIIRSHIAGLKAEQRVDDVMLF